MSQAAMFRHTLTAIAMCLSLAAEARSQPPTPGPRESSDEPQREAPAEAAATDAPRDGRQPPAVQAIEPPAQRPENQPRNASGSQEQESPAEQGRWGIDEWSSVVNAAAAVAITLLTIALFCVAAGERRLNAESLAATRVVERAYVSIAHSPPGAILDPIIMERPNEPAMREVRLHAEVKNYGHTPAEVTAVLVQLLVTDEALPPIPSYDSSQVRRLRTFLVRDEIMKLTAAFPMAADGLTEIHQNRDRWTLFVLGYVDYIDRFGVRHRAGYGRQFNPGLNNSLAYLDPETGEPDAAAFRARNNLTFIESPGYNYDRLRQQGEGNDWNP